MSLTKEVVKSQPGSGNQDLIAGLKIYVLTLSEITIRVDESECLSMASSHDQETERFLSTGTTGRRVSFNEAALFDHSKKTQEKGRRSGTHTHHP